MRLHRDLGPGLFESVYETVLSGRLQSLGYNVDRQLPVDIEFEGQRFIAAFKIDLGHRHIVNGHMEPAPPVLSASLRERITE